MDNMMQPVLKFLIDFFLSLVLICLVLIWHFDPTLIVSFPTVDEEHPILLYQRDRTMGACGKIFFEA